MGEPTSIVTTPKVFSVDEAIQIAGLGATLGLAMQVLSSFNNPAKVYEVLSELRHYREAFEPVLRHYAEIDERIRSYDFRIPD